MAKKIGNVKKIALNFFLVVLVHKIYFTTTKCKGNMILGSIARQCLYSTPVENARYDVSSRETLIGYTNATILLLLCSTRLQNSIHHGRALNVRRC